MALIQEHAQVYADLATVHLCAPGRMRLTNAVKLMGMVVTVDHQLFRDGHDEVVGGRREYVMRWTSAKVPPRDGWVVGVRTVSDGFTGHETYSAEDDYRQESHFAVVKSQRALLVAYGPHMRPVFVPLDGYELGGTPDPFLELRTWTEEDRETMRKEAARMPRDARGRFAKLSPKEMDRG